MATPGIRGNGSALVPAESDLGARLRMVAAEAATRLIHESDCHDPRQAFNLWKFHYYGILMRLDGTVTYQTESDACGIPSSETPHVHSATCYNSTRTAPVCGQ